ncbi:MAG: aldehyde dehydrogenase family protein [Salinirussus sp.]
MSAETRHNLIDGEWTEAATGATFEVRNPAATGEVIGRCQQSGVEDAERAVAAAAAASDAWSGTPAPERGAILRQTSNLLAEREAELAELLTREEGKTLDEATPEVGRAIEIFAYYAEKARDLGGRVKAASSVDSTVSTRREPLGVAGLITPWNYPIAIPAWKIAPALATGNTVVFKPASQAPLVAEAVIECLDEAGAPDGVVNFVTGPGSDVGNTIVTHDAVDAVSFTGSAAVGSTVYEMATEKQKRVQCEMGGKNPTIVTDSADVDEAVEIVGAGAFGVTGQACTACSRAIVTTDRHDEFLEGIVEYAESLAVGDGLEGAEMGPQVNQSELDGTLEYVELAQEEGATLETGGGRPTEPRHEEGYFVEPTVFSGVTPEMRLAQEEVFGPVLAVMEVEDFDEALAVANDVEYGLSASIVTDDLTQANRFVDEIEAGVAKVNEKTTGLELHVPFGGYKQSSTDTYREQGDAALDFYTSTKTVYTNY